MADLKFTERQILEKALGLPSGYVLDFSNRTFQQFIKECVERDIDDEKYSGNGTSKANRLRKFLEIESNQIVGRLISDLVEYAPTSSNPPSADLLLGCKKIADRLQLGIPVAPLITALRWEALDAEAFERLVFNLVSHAKGYSNPKWLTPTNAPDRGRDVSVERTVADQLTGTHVYRVIVQCKHWRGKSIGIAEVTTLLTQMETWEPPKVDQLIIATTGKFSTDAVALIEKRNLERRSPHVAMWPDSHLESLLAERPHFITEFGLR